jgi:hypothetical protein
LPSRPGLANQAWLKTPLSGPAERIGQSKAKSRQHKSPRSHVPEGGDNLLHESMDAAAENPAASGNLRLVAFPIHPLPQQLAVAANGFGLFAGLAFGRFLIGTAQLHFPENAFALHLLLQRFQRLAFAEARGL